MLAFTRKTDYALIALASLARGESEPLADGPAPLSARAIAERYAVPLPILMNVLKDLANAELIRSTRGAKGGYLLARPARHITVHDVVEAIEGRPSLAKCCDEPEEAPCQECVVEVQCPVTHSVRRLNERINHFLREVTLDDLMSGKPDSSRVVPLSSLRTPKERSRERARGKR